MPNYFVEISKQWQLKKALLAYGNEIKNQKTSRDLKSLKSFYEYRGNSVGLKMCGLFLFLKNYLKKYINGENINNLKKKMG